jgi:DNA-binding FadR family transcriptional regulator
MLKYDFFLRYANADVRLPANYLSVVLEEHRAIYEAFQIRNPDLGADAAQAHAFRTMLRKK